MTLNDLLEIVQAHETAIGANCFTPAETNLRALGLIAAKGNKEYEGQEFIGVGDCRGFCDFPVVMTIAGIIVQRFRSQERLRAIEKGVPIPPAWPSARPPLSREEQTTNFRVAGIICVAVSLGLLVLFTTLSETIPEFPRGVIAVSAVPFFIGVGFLIEYRMRRSEIAARDGSASR
jgi:hypothetical protein